MITTITTTMTTPGTTPGTIRLFASVVGPVPDDVIGGALGGVLSSAFDEFLATLWRAAAAVLAAAGAVTDTVSGFSLDTHTGGLGRIWPTLLTISTVIALGLFFWQITISTLRGGRGMWRAATGPFAYGIALTLTAVMVGAAIGAADGLTELILWRGAQVTTFSGAFTHISLADQVLNGVKAVALGLVGVFGVFFGALGWVLEIIWRQTTILVLVATIPITAAGLLAQSTASWFWRGLRWMIAAIAVKPVMALMVVIGLDLLANTANPGPGQGGALNGLVGVLVGVAVLWMALVSPFALFKLLAFVDPDTAPGQNFREQWGRLTGSTDSGGSSEGGDPAGTRRASDEAMLAAENAHTARFDAANPDTTNGTGTPTGTRSGAGSGAGAGDMPTPTPTAARTGDSDPNSSDHNGAQGDRDGGASTPAEGSRPEARTADGNGDGSGSGGEAAPPAAALPPADVGTPHPSPYPRPPAGAGAGSGAGAAAGEEAVEAAVIL